MAIRALDPLPWPWGEDILAGASAMKAVAGVSRLREALAWASLQRCGARARWRIALSLCGHRGRLLARTALVGLRRPDDLRRHLVVHGEEHLHARWGGTILLAFHLGPPMSDVALKLVGHRLTMITAGTRDCWFPDAWRPFLGPNLFLPIPGPHRGVSRAHGVVLHRARQLLLDGGMVHIYADGPWGKEAFKIQLPGARLSVRSGWFSLRRLTHAVVLPVLTHLEGRTQVVTVHPPLPAPAPSDSSDLSACREALGHVLAAYVHRFPGQCHSLAFPTTAPPDELRP
jgi:lauroyl/myristoyl acyltransferase